MLPELIITYKPKPNDVRALRAGLSAYNIAKVPDLLHLPNENYNVIYRDEHGAILGGAVCEFDWGYLYTDTLWTHPDARGSGIATLVMQSAEAYARQFGITQSYLFTANFQAKPFYEHIGYKIFGVLDERPPSGKTYYLQKALVAEMPDNSHITIQNPPIQADSDKLVVGLLNHAAQHNHPIPIDNNNFAVFLKQDDTLVGGAYGGWFWDWFELRYLWITDALRGQGQGQRIMQILERFCLQQPLRGIVCNTASFQSLGFYQQQGFNVIGTLKDRPPQHESYFLYKPL